MLPKPGKVLRIHPGGVVIDVGFPVNHLPAIFDILDCKGATLEVQMQLGGGIVRCIAIGKVFAVPDQEWINCGKPEVKPCEKLLSKIMLDLSRES